LQKAPPFLLWTFAVLTRVYCSRIDAVNIRHHSFGNGGTLFGSGDISSFLAATIVANSTIKPYPNMLVETGIQNQSANIAE
jgi:hypothetical protein